MVYFVILYAYLVIISHFLFVCILFKSHAFPVLRGLQYSLVCHLSLCSLSVCMSLCTFK